MEVCHTASQCSKKLFWKNLSVSPHRPCDEEVKQNCTMNAIALIVQFSFTPSSEERWGEMLRFLQYRFIEHCDAVWQTSIGSACVVEVEAPV